jgi:hypothetical protein
MRKAVWLILGSVLLANVCGCNGKSADQPAQQKAEQKANPVEAASNKDLALKFLLGVQSGDKTQMYQATNLTPELVNDSRDKLIQIKQKKLTDKQRQECEHALKISGDIDFFMVKLRKILPKTSSLKITETAAREATGDIKRFVHTVTVNYSDKAEALRDKTGKPVKELTLRLQQIDYLVDALQIHEFSFNTEDFEKMANRDFEVVSYF